MKKLIIIITIVSGILITSCEKNNTDNSNGNGSGPGKVYAVGYLSKQGYFDLPRTAKLWVDAAETSLTDGTKDAMAIAVFLSGADVYVAGYESNGTNKIAKLWKNGVATNLSDGTKNAVATCIIVSGADVYVAGYESNGTNKVAKLWKNGVASSLSDGTKNVEASSISISGSDVYVAGCESNGTNIVAMLWKNGVASVISSANILSQCRAMVTASGSDIYTGCFEVVATIGTKNFTLRKNGVITATIPNISFENTATTIDVPSQFPFAVIGSDVYIVGTTSAGLSVLKNGIEMPSLKDASMQGYTCFAILSTNVYVGGMRADNTNIGHAAFVKNGATTILNNNSIRNSSLLGIAVKN